MKSKAPVLLTDRRIRRISIAETGERLLDLREHSDLRVDNRKRGENGVFARVREGVAERLLAAQVHLPNGLRLVVVEGLRPLALQSHYFARYCLELEADHPRWSEARVRQEASKYVAPPDIVPPHTTGGAVDVTLAGSDGTEIDMGTPVNASPKESLGACFTHTAAIPDGAQVSRGLLIGAMTSAGFINYPTEWWHWSYGDRYWAFATHRPTAIYGPIEASTRFH